MDEIHAQEQAHLSEIYAMLVKIQIGRAHV